MKPDINELTRVLNAHNQPHLLTFWDQLDDGQRTQLAADIAAIDFDLLDSVIAGESTAQTAALTTDHVQPPNTHPATPTDPQQKELYKKARQRGQELIASGKVAAMVVAGGQGTRLGFDAPKGAFPIGPVSGKTLFEIFAENILATRRRYNCDLPWLVMTSDATDRETRAFFAKHDYFNLGEDTIHFFCQAMMPAVDDQGRILLADKHRVALSPNGHGGSLKALADSGVLRRLIDDGVETISYFQVDNPLVSPADPLFVGLHDLTGSQMSSIAVSKTDDFEKVGNFAKIDGVLQVIEYSDLPDELATAKAADGSRLLDAGSIAIHLLSTKFVSDLTSGQERLRLPWHRAKKKVPHVDIKTGKPIEPQSPNATKFELFVFDALPLAKDPLLLMQPREDCFSPVKNAKGVDSADSARRDMIARAARWLKKCGTKVPNDESGKPTAKIEISPLRALDANQLAEQKLKIAPIQPGDKIYIE